MAEHQLPKLIVRVRFPSSAPDNYPWSDAIFPERRGSTAINSGSVGPSTGPRRFVQFRFILDHRVAVAV